MIDIHSNSQPLLKAEHAVGVRQAFGGNFLDDIPVLYDFAIFHAEQVIKCLAICRTPLTFTDGKHEIPLAQHLVNAGVLEHVVL
jgi:hypothetical protein